MIQWIKSPRNDFRTERGLDRALMMTLAGCDYIRRHHNVLITGPCGVGKSWLACALGERACREDFSVACHRMPRLLSGDTANWPSGDMRIWSPR